MNDQTPNTPHVELSKPNFLPREPAAPMVLQLGHADARATQAFSFGILRQSLLRRLTLAAPLGIVLAAAACAALWYVTEPKYRSLATLQIIDKQPFLAFPTQESSADFAQTQIELLKGPFIIVRAIETEGLAELPELREIRGKEDSVLWIGQRLKATRTGKSQIYEVSFTARSPESARKVVEAIVDTYMQFQTGKSDAQRQRMLEVLEEELVRYDGKIELARRKLRELTKASGGGDGVIMDVPGNGGAAARPGRFALMSNLQQKLVDAEVEVEMAKARVAALADEVTLTNEAPDADGSNEAKQRGYVPEAQIDAWIERDPAIVSLRNDLQHKQEILRRLTKDTARWVGVQKEISTVKTELDAKKAELRPAILQELEQQIAAERRDTLNAAQADLQKRLQAMNLLRARADTERGAQSQHGDKSLELQFARDELTKVEDIRRHIADRAVHLTTESRAPSQVLKIQKATLPEFPEGPTVVKKLAIVGTSAFLAPFLVLIGWNLAHRRIFERAQLEREFDAKTVKFVSEVAPLPTRPRIRKPGSGRAFERQSHLFRESINSLRATLSIDARLKDKQIFLVTSAVSGEGKTNLSSQLAMSWSQAMPGKVIIIDADLRSPSLYELFEIKSHPGLAEVLQGECTVEDATIMDWGDRLYVLPAGITRSGSPAHLFSGQRFREVLAELRRHFDTIFIDVPPVLCASETLLIAKEADAVLMCALHDYSRSGQVKLAYDRLVGGGVNVVGAVLNGAPVHGYSYAYRGYAPT
jgi:capsular exopolysaccharide synthesis family protein